MKPDMLAQDQATVPNIYYWSSIANDDLGILRAVLSWEETRNLLKLCSAQYAGLQFPTTAQGRASDFAVLRILDENALINGKSVFTALMATFCK